MSMQELVKKGSDPIWWTSSGSQNPRSCLSRSISINMGSSPPDCRNVKQFGFQLQDQDSSSMQSTGQSHHAVSNMSGDHTNGQCVSAQSDITYGKQGDKSILSLGTPEFVFPHQVDYGNSVAHLPYPYIDPYYSGIVTSYGPQVIIHPQIMGVTPVRVPLPLDLAENKPMFVNAKQYRAILRRRQSRAKLEAKNKLIKDRKPYLHESRHLHALKRARGSGGRFLNTKQLQELEQNNNSNGQDTSGMGYLQLGGNRSESDLGNRGGAPTTSFSDLTTSSNSGSIFRLQDLRFSGYTHMGSGNRQDGGGGGITCNGSNHRVPVTQ